MVSNRYNNHTQVSCSDCLQSYCFHCASSKNQLACSGVEILQQKGDMLKDMSLTLCCRHPTFRVSMSLLITSLTSIGRSSAHWQYSMTILMSSNTILHKENEPVELWELKRPSLLQTHPTTAKLCPRMTKYLLGGGLNCDNWPATIAKSSRSKLKWYVSVKLLTHAAFTFRHNNWVATRVGRYA